MNLVVEMEKVDQTLTIGQWPTWPVLFCSIFKWCIFTSAEKTKKKWQRIDGQKDQSSKNISTHKRREKNLLNHRNKLVKSSIVQEKDMSKLCFNWQKKTKIFSSFDL